MPGRRLILPEVTPVFWNGEPVPGAQMTIYLNGTTTLVPVWQDPDMTIAAANPQLSTAQGRWDAQNEFLFLEIGLLYTVVVQFPAEYGGQTLTFDNVSADIIQPSEVFPALPSVANRANRGAGYDHQGRPIAIAGLISTTSSIPVQGLGVSVVQAETAAQVRELLGITPELTAGQTVYYAEAYGISTGNGGDANKAALDALIASIPGGVIELPRGVIQLAPLAPIGPKNNLVLRGQGAFAGGTELRCMAATGDFIQFAGAGGHCGIDACYLTAGVRRTGGYAVTFSGGHFHPFVRARIDYHYSGIRVTHASEPHIEVVLRYLSGVHGIHLIGANAAQGVYGATIKIAADNPYPVNGDGVIRTYAPGLAVVAGEILVCPTAEIIYQVMATGTLGATEPSTIGGTGPSDGWSTSIASGTASLAFVSRFMRWVLVNSNVFSVRFQRGSHVLNGYHGLVTADDVPSATSVPQWIWAAALECDHNISHGIFGFRGKSLYCQGAWLGSSRTGRGLMVDTGFGGDVSVDAACRIKGNWQEGIYVGAGARNVRLVGPTVEANSQAGAGLHSGVLFDGAEEFSVSAMNSSGPLQRHGLAISAACDWYSVRDLRARGNNISPIDAAPAALAGRREVSGTIG